VTRMLILLCCKCFFLHNLVATVSVVLMKYSSDDASHPMSQITRKKDSRSNTGKVKQLCHTIESKPKTWASVNYLLRAGPRPRVEPANPF